MCLAIPAKIIAINGEEAVVEMDGVRRTAVVSFIKDPRIGDYVLLHAGFAIRKWSEQDVREYNEIMQGYGNGLGKNSERTSNIEHPTSNIE